MIVSAIGFIPFLLLIIVFMMEHYAGEQPVLICSTGIRDPRKVCIGVLSTVILLK